MTSKCDIVHSNENYLKLPNNLRIPTEDFHMHSFLPSHLFWTDAPNSSSSFQAILFCATAVIQETDCNRAWSDIKKIVDKDHKHVCGHAELSDMQTLLERNNSWNHEVKTYLNRIVDSCSNCARCYEPKQARKVFLSSLNRSFNDVARIDHLHLGNMRICHIMDAATRYSVGAVVPDTGMVSAIDVLDSHWISQFWAPNSMQFDQAFDNEIFKNFLNVYGIESRPIPARRHNKNALESKHKIIRDIFIRLQSESDPSPEAMRAQQAIIISNDSYGNDVCSAYELAKGFSRPIETETTPKIIPVEIMKARDAIMAKRKLNLILRSKSTSDLPLKIGDLVQVFIKLQHEKRGKWSSTKPVLSYDKRSGIVSVAGQNGRKINAAVEDVPFAVVDDELATKYQEAIDTLDICIEYSLDDIPDEPYDIVSIDLSETDYHEIGETLTLNVGDKIEVYWPDDDKYYPGTVLSYCEQSGKHSIHYHDGDKETLDIGNELWRALKANPATIADLFSTNKEALETYFKLFAHKEFMLH